MLENDIFGAFFTLLGVAAFLGIVFLIVKRYSKKVKNKSGVNIKIHERTPIFPKGHLVIAEAAGKFYLLGATENNINILKEIEVEDKDNPNFNTAEIKNPPPVQSSNNDDLSFKSFLKSTISSKQKN